MQLCELSLSFSLLISIFISLYTHHSHSPRDVIYDTPIDTVVSGPNTSTIVTYEEVLNPANNAVQRYGVWDTGYG